jgi:hypothetical protein
MDRIAPLATSGMKSVCFDNDDRHRRRSVINPNAGGNCRDGFLWPELCRRAIVNRDVYKTRTGIETSPINNMQEDKKFDRGH